MNEARKIVQMISENFHPLDQKEQELLSSILKEETLKKGELLLKEGDVARDIYWVGKGMLRQFYYKDGREVTEHFACENQGALCINSLFLQKPSSILVEALEDSTILLMPYKKFISLAQRYPQIAKLLRKILEESLIMSQQKADSWRYETVHERYKRFQREYPDAAKRASVNHIASYLLMTPESLSRVRAGKL
ncbi:Crp/Fnr family transcriptional regulator [uncultured Draconibacterium sp.]|uniref:Crp/Fnr family transcriptional regulator n=1 Tax=uncultured Draconibacterium sp. TaxID=1573823 RepID=UPI0029C95DB1|nr:Crp/Fnr family transcriptional regulator [uncultured Draconibacterium sp.]